MTKFAGKSVEPAEPDPGPGWLRSRFLRLPWPRPGHEAPCDRPSCPVCGEAPIPMRGAAPRADGGRAMAERNFFLERLMERALELQAKHQGNPETYHVELSKLMMQNARNENERKEWEELLEVNKFFTRRSQYDERAKVNEQ